MWKIYITTSSPLAALSYTWVQHHWIWDLHLKLCQWIKLRTLMGFLSPSLDRPVNHHSKEPSLNQLYAFPRELSTWFVLGFWPLLRWYSEHRWLMTCKTLKLTGILWLHVHVYLLTCKFRAANCHKTEARTNISRISKPRACFWMQAAASWQPQVRFITGGLQIPATATLPILKSGTLDPLSMYRTMPDLSRENIGYSW